jgi:hypothetical protein
MNKYDAAIEFLKNVEPGSYFDECAALIEELLAQTHAKEDQGISKEEMSDRRGQTFGAESWYKRNRQRPSSAIPSAE